MPDRKLAKSHRQYNQTDEIEVHFIEKEFVSWAHHLNVS